MRWFHFQIVSILNSRILQPNNAPPTRDEKIPTPASTLGQLFGSRWGHPEFLDEFQFVTGHRVVTFHTDRCKIVDVDRKIGSGPDGQDVMNLEIGTLFTAEATSISIACEDVRPKILDSSTQHG
jgi:hypothetical protein